MSGWEIYEQLIAEAARVRDEVMPGYLALGAPGESAVRNMRRQLDDAMRTLLKRDAARASVLVAGLRAQRPQNDSAQHKASGRTGGT